LICDTFGIDTSARGVSWLPPYHDMGLIGGVLQPLYSGFPATLMAPAAFLQRPFRWLEAITKFQATASAAPNFAYDLCVRSITPEQREQLDLSHWRLAVCGSDTVRTETLDRFAETFASCGFNPTAFCPCYGLAEATLLVSGRGPGGAKLVHLDASEMMRNRVQIASGNGKTSRTLVGVGPSVSRRLLIVDPEALRPCAADEIGEIWVADPSVACGYWQREEATAQSFGAHLANGDGPFLRTGDLGFLRDGELFVAGRLKELIIVRGRNHYPLDIELTAGRAHPALRADGAAAFAVERQGGEALVIVHEISRGARNVELEAVAAAIRRAVAADHEIDPATVVLTSPLAIPKTSSGKTERHACRDAYLAGTLPVLYEWRRNEVPARSHAAYTPDSHAAAARDIQAWLIARIADALDIARETIDPNVPFTELGLDSLKTVTVSGELETWLGRSLPSTLLWDYPSIAALSRHLAQDGAAPEIARGRRGSFANEPLAIIGLGCRFPNAPDTAAFWKLLCDGVDSISPVPGDRWDADALAGDPEPPPGVGGFLANVDGFDAGFFGIAPREVVRMDPQQRLFLEVAWEAFESAACSTERLAGSATGVFLGISNSDFGHAFMTDRASLDAYTGTGSALSMAANRLSYILGLQGPSMAVDTACSSSLVALDLACQSLRSGRCDRALAGGVNLILGPELTLAFTRARMMAPDGRCKTFDADANGYVRGEGCGAVVLKRLSDAERDGDCIRAVIRGSAVNHDGRSNGLTAPNGQSQEAVVRAALADAGVPAAAVGYVEAHGTGTPLGDPIELRALARVYGEGRPATSPLIVGSVKTNIGHLEAAAGIAGVIKTVLALEQGEIPAQLHFTTPTPHVDWPALPLRVAQERQGWPGLQNEAPRLAGVSSFGFGGTNAHVILEAPPRRSAAGEAAGPAEARVEQLVPLAARSEPALRALAGRYAAYLRAHPAQAGDVAYTAGVGRAALPLRAAVLGPAAALADRLEALARGEPAAEVIGAAAAPAFGGVGFLFTGQGSQYAGMGCELYAAEPVFSR